MIIDTVKINNFGVYAGTQALDLSPPSQERPVVLVGGLNGGGKTTLLDAIQLALYGRFAPCSNRGNLPYTEYLRRSISQTAEERKAAISIEFRHTNAGVEDEYRVTRAWRENCDKVSETLTVVRNGEYDALLSNQWVEAIESILPRRIANLFLFDGEQIESYASPSASQELIRSAIHSLLGIDIVDQLDRDLGTLSQQKLRKKHSDDEQKDLDLIERELADHESQKAKVAMERAALRTKRDRLEKKLFSIQMEFEQKGGVVFERRTELEAELAELRTRYENVERELREQSSELAPFCMVEELIFGVNNQSRKEHDAELGHRVLETIEGRDRQILDFIQTLNPTLPSLDVIEEFLVADQTALRQALNTERTFGLSRSALESTSLLLGFDLPRIREELRKVLSEHSEISRKLDEKETEVASIPAPAVIQRVIEKREKAQSEISEIEQALARLDKEYLTEEFLIERLSQRLERGRERQIKTGFAQDDDRRVVQHASKVQDTLRTFKKAAVERHLAKIEILILESFAALHRKKNTITRIKISPDDYSVELINKSGKIVRPERLSAGERQLLAVATLWGLAKASNRHLPTIIDTPLGRLDSSHRGNLVDLYFPKASHQVILLSTDEEISGSYLEKLTPSIGSRYELRFSEYTGGTEIVPGYFQESVTNAH